MARRGEARHAHCHRRPVACGRQRPWQVRQRAQQCRLHERDGRHPGRDRQPYRNLGRGGRGLARVAGQQPEIRALVQDQGLDGGPEGLCSGCPRPAGSAAMERSGASAQAHRPDHVRGDRKRWQAGRFTLLLGQCRRQTGPAHDGQGQARTDQGGRQGGRGR